MYEYMARVTKIISLDTIQVEVDLGFRVFKKVLLRLVGVAPHSESLLTRAARDYMEAECPLAAQVRIKSEGEEPDGRWRAHVYLGIGYVSLSDQLIVRGFARFA